MFGQNPSDVAILDERVGEIGRFYFDRGIWAFGEAVANRLEEVIAGTRNPVIARAQREREWARLMGDDMATSAAGFADPGEGFSAHARVVGEPAGAADSDETMLSDGELQGNYW